MRDAKIAFLAQAQIKEAKHPKTAPKLICFSLAAVFFGLSIILLGIANANIYGGVNITQSWGKLVLTVMALLTIQLSIVFSSLGVTSSKYVFYCVSSVILSLSIALDVALALYYFIWVI